MTDSNRPAPPRTRRLPAGPRSPAAHHDRRVRCYSERQTDRPPGERPPPPTATVDSWPPQCAGQRTSGFADLSGNRGGV